MGRVILNHLKDDLTQAVDHANLSPSDNGKAENSR
jgi:hypothetical protein